MSDDISWTLEFGQQRPWTEMWDFAKYNLGVLEARYDGRLPLPDGVLCKYDVFNFFVSAYHVHDHLANDPALPQAVRNNAKAAKTSLPIRAAGDIADTFKHYTRDSKSRIARIVTLTDKPTVTIGWTKSDGTEVLKDARDLAREVMSFWAQFIADNAIAP